MSDLATLPKFQIESLITEVRRLAQETPERVARCYYFNACQEPECIMGQALANLGYSKEEVNAAASTGGGIGNIARVLRNLQVDRLHTQEYWLVTLQAQQDQGSCWGAALSYADAEVPL